MRSLAVVAALLCAAAPAFSAEVPASAFVGPWSPDSASSSSPPPAAPQARAPDGGNSDPTPGWTIPLAPGALKPDFMPDPRWLNYTLYVDVVNGSADPCLIEEKCIGGLGMRTVLRFGSLIHNLGPGDAVVGKAPAIPNDPNHPPWFVWSNCHQHWHYVGYADYRILDPVTNATVAKGHKNGFCLMDSICPTGINGTHDCETQGITAKCADYYDDGLTCQWVDITDSNLDLRKKYILSVTINPNRTFPETNYDNNQALVPFQLDKLTVRCAQAIASSIANPSISFRSRRPHRSPAR